MQDLCMWISCARSLCQDLCIRILYDHLCKISVCGSLVQDLSGVMSASGSSRTCRISCARSLYEIRHRNFTSISRDGHARSPQTVALRNPKSQFHLHSAHLTRTISAQGCASKPKKAISPAFRALDTHDLRRGFTFRNHASEVLRLPRNHEPRSYEILHWPHKSIPKLQFQKCNPSQELSPLTSNYRIHGADSLHLPRKTQSFE